MDNNIHKKYKKYKKKYVDLKQLNDGFYLIHGTDLPNLENILKTGYIFSGRYVPEKTRLGSWEKLPYVYCNIYFDDIKNIPYAFGYTLILHPKIIKENGIIFNKSWAIYPTEDSIVIKPNDKEYEKKINLIKEFVKNPTNLVDPTMLPQIMHHEVLVKDKIDVHKYLIGLILPGMEDMYDNIQKILNDYGYKNIKIFTTNHLPDIKELI